MTLAAICFHMAGTSKHFLASDLFSSMVLCFSFILRNLDHLTNPQDTVLVLYTHVIRLRGPDEQEGTGTWLIWKYTCMLKVEDISQEKPRTNISVKFTRGQIWNLIDTCSRMKDKSLHFVAPYNLHRDTILYRIPWRSETLPALSEAQRNRTLPKLFQATARVICHLAFWAQYIHWYSKSLWKIRPCGAWGNPEHEKQYECYYIRDLIFPLL